jgi:hypothetical protein
MPRRIILVLLALSVVLAAQSLRVSPNGRFLQTADGKPFFWLADTGWLMFQKLDKEETEKYLEDRRRKGFNVIQCMVLHQASNRNFRGVAALVDGDPGRPNAPGGYDYWEHVDWVVDLAASKGIYLAMVPAWGSIARSKALNESNVVTYGRFLADRYKGKPNLIWLNGGDTQGDRETEVWKTLGRTLRERDPNHLITYHPFGRTQSSTWFHDEPWLDFNMFQSGHRRYGQDPAPGAKEEDNYLYVQEDYAKKPVKPTLDGEPSYEGIPQGLHDWKEPLWTDADARRYAYWSVFSGSFGHTYGSAAIMSMRKPDEVKRGNGSPKTWEQAMQDPGAGQMLHLKSLILSRPFFERVPDQTLLVGPNGKRYDYIAATRGERYAMLYTYTGRPFEVNLDKLAGRLVKAAWFNPRSGEEQAIGTFERKGTRTFTPPGRAVPGNDWVLLLDDASAPVTAILGKYCAGCHNQQMLAAGLSLSGAPDQLSREAREKVLHRVQAKTMPPTGLPAPTAAEWALVESAIGVPAEANNPGRVTARRLNRFEYNNTIRDLLRVPARPATEFPTDDSGYGFDNIGDVLSLSPMLMEKYVAAARKVARLAVDGEPVPPNPVTLGHYTTKRSPDEKGSITGPGILPYSLRGALYTTHLFPWTAEYEFRFRVVNFRYIIRPRNSPPLTQEESARLFPPTDAVLTIDGRKAGATTIIGSLAYEFDRGDIVIKAPVPAGEHQVRISFPDLANLPNGRDNVNVDERRKLWIDYLDIAGPFNPSPALSESYKHLFGCGHGRGKHVAACTRKAIETLATRAYRRPLTPGELKRLLAVSAGSSAEESVRIAVQAVLVSPHFLFRIERGPSGEISEPELASRLSYFLWGSMPDDELARLARGKQLRLNLEPQVHRMLADPKSTALVDGFAAQWLQLRNLDRAKPDPKRFPNVDEELLASMRRETDLFLAAVMREDRSVLDFLDAKFTYLNGPLARHYGISGATTEQFERVALKGPQRGGLMTQASILTISSYPTRTSPVLRGKWVLESLLGTPPPPPPPDVPELKAENLTAASLRQQLEVHRASATCASCHDQMDPLGFGLESYDATGKWRTHDGKFAIDASGTLPGGTKFDGPAELISVLKSRPDAFIRSLTEKLLTYALGRGLERYDTPAVNSIAEATASNGGRFSKLILEIVRSTPFQQRRAEGVTLGTN